MNYKKEIFLKYVVDVVDVVERMDVMVCGNKKRAKKTRLCRRTKDCL